MRGSGVAPRVLLITRPTTFEELIARHGTLAQARFFLHTRGQKVEPLQVAHQLTQDALTRVRRAIPQDWRQARLTRADLSRFVFEPDDIVVAVGQDGLVANAAKYLTRQRLIGINPDPASYDGVLVRHRPRDAEALLHATHADRVEVEARTMVKARVDDGQTLQALNEVFFGHRSHQSARYRVELGGKSECHSSSGLVVSSGTGATGWARSIHRQRQTELELPRPTDPTLVYFAREAFPSVTTGTDLTDGLVEVDESVEIRSEMNDGGVLFGDGMEDDHIDLRFGSTLTISRSEHSLQLVA